MNYSKQIRTLKKKLKSVSGIKGMKRGQIVLNNYRITRKIAKVQKRYGDNVINHEYFKKIKDILDTKSSQATLNKVKRLVANSKKTDQQIQATVKKNVNSTIKNYMNDYQKESANTDISATNQDCLDLGKQVIKLICLKHPTTKLSIRNIRKEMHTSLNRATQILRKADATVDKSNNSSKGEPPITPNYDQNNQN